MAIDSSARGLGAIALLRSSSINRAHISSLADGQMPTSFIASGFAADGDLGTGAPHTNQGTNSATVTITNASPGVVSWTSHNLVAGAAVVFGVTGSGVLNTGLTAATTYYVSGYGLASGTFSVSTTFANAIAGLVGGCVNTSSAGTAPVVCCSSPLAIQNASGTWFRAVLNGIVNAGWFGLLGGSNDDTAAMQLAITTAVTNGLRLHIPKGTYKTTAPLIVGDVSANLYSGFRIEGVNRGATIINLSNLATAVVTIDIANPALIHWAAHGFAAGTPVSFTSSVQGGLPTGIVASTLYYVSSAGLVAGAFQIADTAGHATGGTNSIITTGSQSGTITGVSPVASVIDWKKNAWRDSNFGKMTLQCGNFDQASVGILLESSEISNLAFEGLEFNWVTTAISLLVGTGSNGEFCAFSDIQCNSILNFFYSNAGQALDHTFFKIFIYYRPGGILFALNPTGVGGGLNLYNVNATPAPNSGFITNTTLFYVIGNHDAPITVIGGRFEHLTCIAYTNSGATSILFTNFNFIGTSFTTDFRTSDATNLMTAVIWDAGTGIPANRFLFQGCRFESVNSGDGNQAFPIQLGWSYGEIRFQSCGWHGYGSVPTFQANQETILNRVRYDECQYEYSSGVVGRLVIAPPAHVYTTNTSTIAMTLTAANIYGGTEEQTLNLTGVISANTAVTLPLVSAVISALGNVYAGMSWKLRIRNGGGTGSGTWTLTTNTNWTIQAGSTVIIPVGGFVDYYVTFATATTATIQSI